MDLRRKLILGLSPVAAFGIAVVPASAAVADTVHGDEVRTTAEESFESGEDSLLGLEGLLGGEDEGGEFVAETQSQFEGEEEGGLLGLGDLNVEGDEGGEHEAEESEVGGLGLLG